LTLKQHNSKTEMTECNGHTASQRHWGYDRTALYKSIIIYYHNTASHTADRTDRARKAIRRQCQHTYVVFSAQSVTEEDIIVTVVKEHIICAFITRQNNT